MAKKSGTPFSWNDPLLLEQQLSHEERMVRDTAKASAVDVVLPDPGEVVVGAGVLLDEDLAAVVDGAVLPPLLEQAPTTIAAEAASAITPLIRIPVPPPRSLPIRDRELVLPRPHEPDSLAFLGERLGRGRRQVLLGDDQFAAGVEGHDVAGIRPEIDDAAHDAGRRCLVGSDGRVGRS